MKAIQQMLMGISVMLLGGFILMDQSNNWSSFELYILLIGFGITLFGFIGRKEEK
ncbi:hypothetical protein H9649_13200 [Sporosarcina sp. Sa2YVA2]|uniref:DUF3188 domain-containing protein n=1 Tax=Sporosarcina quadrami TaxID=2762234 RepID=A0ABR8UC13_9BACL|nr:hypothetical protein [Sporosarcina quadrami]MBD7985546.1 hypothetical protein [Sporosarcina quadrami]